MEGGQQWEGLSAALAPRGLGYHDTPRRESERVSHNWRGEGEGEWRGLRDTLCRAGGYSGRTYFSTGRTDVFSVLKWVVS